MRESCFLSGCFYLTDQVSSRKVRQKSKIICRKRFVQCKQSVVGLKIKPFTDVCIFVFERQPGLSHANIFILTTATNVAISNTNTLQQEVLGKVAVPFTILKSSEILFSF